MTFHFAEAAANLLTNAALDPLAKIPEYKACAVRLEALNGRDEACDPAGAVSAVSVVHRTVTPALILSLDGGGSGQIQNLPLLPPPSCGGGLGWGKRT